SNDEAKLPIVEMFHKYTSNVLLGLGARHVDGVFFNVFAVFAISYLVDTVHVTRNDALIGLMIGAAVLTICIPLAGYLSDKMSRAKLYG
ncbi:MAG: MFS transporter, partial [Deltaproteobacteria bacterium]|nr:MFS transporter [Deltaproteobacteria bacterium]